MPTEIEIILKGAARIIMGAALDLIQSDPHQWSERPCSTCRAVTALLGRPFGCILYEEERKGKRCPR
jgi:hypothetical protein